MHAIVWVHPVLHFLLLANSVLLLGLAYLIEREFQVQGAPILPDFSELLLLDI
jgi:hypothetical protein